MFDPIAYEKTAGVLNMIEAYVGPEAFRKGVSSYLDEVRARATPPARTSGWR